MDGHIAALEMRETDYSARIAISARGQAPRRPVMQPTRRGCGCTRHPSTQSVFDEQWDAMLGEIPPAPGLADLTSSTPRLRTRNRLPIPSDAADARIGGDTIRGYSGTDPEPEEQPRKKRKWLRGILLLLVVPGPGPLGRTTLVLSI
ncbi:MAG: hypothetical protein Ct9H300mP30_4190 [Methanobacteriota archaeon]|nr:MAG: hypothetical protein Ct9H300mP30_4190 [Euryarchaeota archaeon]